MPTDPGRGPRSDAARRSATPSTSSTPPCGTARSGRASPTRSRTRSPSRPCSTNSGSASSRVAGPARCPRTPSSSPGPGPASWPLRTASLVAFGATRKAGVRAKDDPQVRALLDSGAAGDHPGRQVRRPARRAGAAHHPGGEPGHGVGHRARCWSTTAAGCSWTASTSSTATSSTATTASGSREAAVGAGADVVGAVRHQRRHAADDGAADRRRGAGAHRFPARHPLPGRHQLRGGEHRRRGAGRRHPRAVHRQRVRRAGRQRRPVRGRRQSGHQDGPAGAAGRRDWPT